MKDNENPDQGLDATVARAFGRPAPMTLQEAKEDLLGARVFGRVPRPEAAAIVEANERTTARDEATQSDDTPWRTAVTPRYQEAFLSREQELVSLVSSRRGQTMEAARQYVEGTLREAWCKALTKGFPSDGITAVADKIAESKRHLSHLTPIIRESQARRDSTVVQVEEQAVLTRWNKGIQL